MSAENVATLKKQLEQLFPGKWLAGGDGSRALLTGIREFDSGAASGLSRRKVSEWVGPPSSGKTTFLRAILSRWCLSGLNIAYIDTFSRLVAADWAFVSEGHSGSVPLNMVHQTIDNGVRRRGQFMVVRVSECLERNEGSEIVMKDIKQEACWIVEQIVRSKVFDVVVFDQGESLKLSDRMYARLSRALDRSRTALIVMKDSPASNSVAGGSTWGCQTRASFGWSSSSVDCDKGIAGLVSILPAVNCSVFRDGLRQDMEGRLTSNVQNRLFTHPQIPDRRTSKTRPRSK